MTLNTRRQGTGVGIIAAALLATLTIAGCSSPGDASAGQTQTDTQQFSLAFGPSNDEETGYEILAKQYMQEHPEVTITLNKLPGETYPQAIRTQLQAGNASDVFVAGPGTASQHGVVTLAEAGLLEPLGASATALIPPGSESLLQVDGKTYGQPLSISFIGQNFSLAAGVDFPEDFEELIATCKAVAKAGKSFVVAAGAVPMSNGIMAQAIAATRVYADDPDWNVKRAAGEVTFADSKGWHDTLQAIVDMKDAGCFQAGVEGAGFDAISSNMGQGLSLSMFGPSNSAANINRLSGGAAQMVVEVFPPASAGDTSFGVANATYVYALAANSKNKVAATKFLEWMAEPAQSKAFADVEGDLPVSGLDTIDLTGTPFEPIEDLIHDRAYAPWPNTTWANASVYETLGSGVQGLLTDQKSIDQVLAEVDTAWEG